jgi:hypothetical protein
MQRFICSLIAALACGPLMAADVGVSISVGQPGFYGHIDIGNVPQPVLIYSQPVIIQPGVVRAPVYLHVPPGHAKDWAKHCGKYNACGERVYFVQENWYNQVYVPHYQSQHGKGKGKDNGKGKGKGKGHD